jgi:predicted ester cyclase
VWTAFPDFSLELLNAGEIEPGVVALHWRVRGTHTVPGVDGSDPTGRAVTFKGASIILVEGDKIRSDHAYFDRQTIAEQLEPK